MEVGIWRDAWGRADGAAAELREALAGLGLELSGSVRPGVTRTGGAYVDLGRLPADAARRIAEALAGRGGGDAPGGGGVRRGRRSG